MKFSQKLVCSLACAGSVTIPKGASALDTTQLYDAAILTTAPQAVGSLVFERDSSNAGQACRYAYAWVDTAVVPPSARGFVSEAKTQGNSKCHANSLRFFSTIVQLEPGFPSDGFDYFDRHLPVFALLVGETPYGELGGVLQFTSAVPTIYSFDLEPRP